MTKNIIESKYRLERARRALDIATASMRRLEERYLAAVLEMELATESIEGAS